MPKAVTAPPMIAKPRGPSRSQSRARSQIDRRGRGRLGSGRRGGRRRASPWARPHAASRPGGAEDRRGAGAGRRERCGLAGAALSGSARRDRSRRIGGPAARPLTERSHDRSGHESSRASSSESPCSSSSISSIRIRTSPGAPITSSCRGRCRGHVDEARPRGRSRALRQGGAGCRCAGAGRRSRGGRWRSATSRTAARARPGRARGRAGAP